MAAYTNTTLVVDQTDVVPYLGAGIDTNYTITMQDDVGMDQEAYLCCLLNYDVVTNLATLTANGKRILSEYVARGIAMAGIAYNFLGEADTGFTREEAEDMIIVHLKRMKLIEKVLTGPNVRTYLGIT